MNDQSLIARLRGYISKASFATGADRATVSNLLDEVAAALTREQEAQPAHSDDLAVDAFAVAMKAKLSKQRAKGYGGWETCPVERLQRMLVEHVAKGDPVDVANFAMMLSARNDAQRLGREKE